MILQAQGVSVRRPHPGGRLVLDTIQTKFVSPEFTVLAGANGSGKSMLLRLLTGLEKPSAGQVLVDGRAYPSAYGDLGRRVGIVFQNPDRQIIGQTVEEDVQFGLRIHVPSRKAREETCRRVLEWAELWDRRDQAPETLSGGEIHRLALASVLALDPEFILLDEPFTGLDYTGVRRVLSSVVDLKARGKGIILVTHQLDMVLAHADRLVVLREGRIVADGVPERILPHVEDHGIRKPLGKLPEMSWL